MCKMLCAFCLLIHFLSENVNIEIYVIIIDIHIMASIRYFHKLCSYVGAGDLKSGVLVDLLYAGKSGGYVSLCFDSFEKMVNMSWQFTNEATMKYMEMFTTSCEFMDLSHLDEDMIVTLSCTFQDLDDRWNIVEIITSLDMYVVDHKNVALTFKKGCDLVFWNMVM